MSRSDASRPRLVTRGTPPPPEPPRDKKSRRGQLRETRIGAYLEAHRWAVLGTLGQFQRMPFSTLLTCVALAIALAFPAVLLALLQNVQRVTTQWDGGTQISLYLKAEASDAQAVKLADQLRANSDIGKVEYISKSRALEDFQRNSGLGEALALLSDNPLPPVLVVHPKDRRANPDAIEKLAKQLKANPLVDLAQWDMQWLQRLHGLIAVGERAVLVIGALLLLAAFVVIGNTIRLAVQNRAQEIKVTKLIGASDAFVRRPFLYSGLVYGLAGSAVAIALVHGVLWALTDPVRAVAATYGSNFALTSLGTVQTMLVVVTGVTLGLLGAWLSVSRHLRSLDAI